MEVKATLFTDAFANQETFDEQIKEYIITRLKSMLDVDSESEFNTLYGSTFSYIQEVVYNYYENYYLATARVDNFIRLYAVDIAGILPYYDNLIKEYKNTSRNFIQLRKEVYTSKGSATSSRDNKQRYASTPEGIEDNNDFLDTYSTSQQKSNTTGKDDTSLETSRNIEGDITHLWNTLQNIPSVITRNIYGHFAKYFTSETMEACDIPMVYLTLTEKIEEFESSGVENVSLTLDNETKALKVSLLMLDLSTLESEVTLPFVTESDFEDFETRLQEVETQVTNLENSVESIETQITNIINGNTPIKLPIASSNQLGVVKAQPKTDDDKVPVKIDEEGNLWFNPNSADPTTIPIANDVAIGGVKANAKQSSDTTAVNIDPNGFLWVAIPEIPEPDPYILPQATGSALGGVKANAKGSDDTQPVTIDNNGFLWTKESGGGGDVPSDKIPTEILNLSKETSHTKGLVLAHDGVPLSPQDIAYFSYIFEATISDISSSVSNSDFLSNNADLIKSIVGLEKYNELVSSNSLPFTIFNTEQLQMSYIHFTITNEPNTDLIVPVLGIGQSQDFGSSTIGQSYFIDFNQNNITLKSATINKYYIPSSLYVFDYNTNAALDVTDLIDKNKLLNADILNIYVEIMGEQVNISLYKYMQNYIEGTVGVVVFNSLADCKGSSNTNNYGPYGCIGCSFKFVIDGDSIVYLSNTGGALLNVQEDEKIRAALCATAPSSDIYSQYLLSMPFETKQLTYQWSGSISPNQGQYINITSLPYDVIIKSFQVAADVVSGQPYTLGSNWYVYVYNTTTSEIQDLSIIIKYYEVW